MKLLDMMKMFVIDFCILHLAFDFHKCTCIWIFQALNPHPGYYRNLWKKNVKTGTLMVLFTELKSILINLVF